ncbi:hypothetical protein PV797_04535 [Clostridiaceae bacterium M8S5]|nr:hypothetical protein PV797_04535 [Clostridiaceae bacterium M8S5]
MSESIGNGLHKQKNIEDIISLYKDNLQYELHKLKYDNKYILNNAFNSSYRVWYYSTLYGGLGYSPANYIKGSLKKEQGFDKEIFVTLKTRIDYNNEVSFTEDCKLYSIHEHPVVEDLLYIMREKDKNINNIEKIMADISYEDSDYYRYINLLANKITKIQGFARMSKGQQLEAVLSQAIIISRNKLNELLDTDMYTEDYMISILDNNKDVQELKVKYLNEKYCNNDFKFEPHDINDTDIFHRLVQEYKISREIINSRDLFDRVFDKYFTCVFGCYLQIICPLYINEYDFNKNIKLYYAELNEENSKADILYKVPHYYNLSELGKEVMRQYRTTHKGDLFLMLDNTDDYHEIHDKIIDINRKNNELRKDSSDMMHLQEPEKDSIEEKIYCFLIKNEEEILNVEIMGTQSLEDLHECIYENFYLENTGTYSFVLNKDEDNEVEYTTPIYESGYNSTTDGIINELDLTLYQEFVYTYDFEEEQVFDIQFTEIKDMDYDEQYPVCK